jgi:hypothetical protein
MRLGQYQSERRQAKNMPASTQQLGGNSPKTPRACQLFVDRLSDCSKDEQWMGVEKSRLRGRNWREQKQRGLGQPDGVSCRGIVKRIVKRDAGR